jgi:antitoxin YefM
LISINISLQNLEIFMATTLTPTIARANLYKLIDEVNASHTPVHIHSKRKGAVLLSEEDWRAIEETLYLLSIPNMRESIRKGLKTPIDECSKELEW